MKRPANGVTGNGEHGGAHPSDAELLARWRAEDMSAGQKLFERYFKPLERFFLNKVSRSVEVTDLMQDTFAACVEGRVRMSEDTRFRSYLFAVAYRLFHQHLRQKYRLTNVERLEDVCVSDLSSGPMTVLARRREHRLLLEGLRSISTVHQTILELHYWERMSVVEIGDVLGIPRGTASSRLIRARAALEKAMTRIATSQEVLDSTLTSLDDWARSCRELLAAEDSARAG